MTPAARVPQPQRRRALDRAAWFNPSLPIGLADTLWTDPESLMRSGTMLKDGDRCTVVRIDPPATDVASPGAATPLVLKRYNLKDQFHTAVHWVIRSRARWSWCNARLLIGAGLRTPTPLACLDERRAGLLRRRSYLLTSFVPGVSLRELVFKKLADDAQLRRVAEQFVKIWGELGALRIGHGDMKASNFVVDPQGMLWMIDLDGMRVYRSSLLFRRERRNDLSTFLYNWQDHPQVAALFRTRLGAM
jgi:hypothetical protein